jgi:hypothetical protein
MSAQWDFLSLLTLIVTAAAPAAGQPAAPLPDISGSWNDAALHGVVLPLSGPGPVGNRSRMRTGPQAGVGDCAQLVGDYTNPILRPWAAEVVKKFGDMSLAGQGYPTPPNHCWPDQVPFAFANYGMLVIQQPDKVTILYPFEHQFRQVRQVRQVRLNQPHPAQVTPSRYGDCVGHYVGDALVVDPVGIKAGLFSMIDWCGPPFSEALHAVERYRLLDYHATMEAIERDAKEHFQTANPDNGPAVDRAYNRAYKGPALQVQVTVEHEGAFTTPWSATVTFQRALDEGLELVCADNTQWCPGTHPAVPAAGRLDF